MLHPSTTVPFRSFQVFPKIDVSFPPRSLRPSRVERSLKRPRMGLLEKRYGPCAHGHPNIECIFFEDFPTMSTKKPKLFFALEKSTYNENGVYMYKKRE